MAKEGLEKTKDESHSSIILSYNNKDWFRLDDYLQKYDQVDWGRYVQPIGTTIYFFCSDKNKRRVMYEGVVIKSPVPYKEMFDDADYEIAGSRSDSLYDNLNKEGDNNKVMRIKIIRRADETVEALSENQLLNCKGFSDSKYRSRRGLYIPLAKEPELEKYLKGAFDRCLDCKTNNRTPDIISIKGKCKQLLKSCYNLILTGAPGTGKTFLARQIAEEMILDCAYDENKGDHKTKMDEQFGFVQFHPSFDYTDFVEGLRPVQDDKGNVGFKREDGIFMAFCRKALKAYNAAEKKDDAPKYIFVIDEINRGEISKIFGELFFCIDPGYRGSKGEVTTQYANLWTDMFDRSRRFYIPENVYIIGTMNDIDRSVESMDFAMRRRFSFKEITAEDSMQMLDDDKAWKGNKPTPDTLRQLKDRMKRLNNKIWHKPEQEETEKQKSINGLSSAYHIGAAYFLKLSNYAGDPDKGFESLWNNHLEGLLREYLRGMPNADELLKDLKNAYDLKNAIDTKDATNESVKQTDDDGATER